MVETRVLVRELMSRDIIAVDPDATVAEALARMEQHGIHELPVMQNSSLKGWVSYDSLIRHPHMPPQSKVTSIMDASPRIQKDADVVQAADLMIRNNVRAVPVVDGKGMVVGILSRTDLLKAAVQIPEIGQQPLDKVMTRDLETIAEDGLIDEAARRLRDLSIRQLLVLDGKGKLLGTVGREAVMHALTSEDRGASSVRGKGGSLGSGGRSKDRRLELKGLIDDAVTLSPSSTLADAVQVMTKAGCTCVVAVDDGFPVGVVARANVLERLAARQVVDGPLVQLIGLHDHADSSMLDQVHSLASNSLRKVEKEFRVEFLAIHYKKLKGPREGEAMFNVTAHLYTDKKFVTARTEDWDLYKATVDVLSELERRAIESKELRLERRKGAPRRAASFYTAAP